MDDDVVRVTYRLHASGPAAEQRAQVLALEQSIEMPLAAVVDARVRGEVVARVTRLEPQPDGCTLAEIALSAETIGGDAGQLMNMLFGNSSLHGDVEVVSVRVPVALAERFRGPLLGIDGIRDLTGVRGRPLTCTALKPIGSTLADLARMTGVFAEAGIDVIKDDHGWPARALASFEQRVVACQREVEHVNRGRTTRTLYAPALSGDAEAMREQLEFAQGHGVAMVLVTPMIAGVSNFNALRREFPATGVPGAPRAGRQPDFATGAAGNAVPAVRRGCGDLPQSRRPLYLHAVDLRCHRCAPARTAGGSAAPRCRCPPVGCRSSACRRSSPTTAAIRCC